MCLSANLFSSRPITLPLPHLLKPRRHQTSGHIHLAEAEHLDVHRCRDDRTRAWGRRQEPKLTEIICVYKQGTTHRHCVGLLRRCSLSVPLDCCHPKMHAFRHTSAWSVGREAGCTVGVSSLPVELNYAVAGVTSARRAEGEREGWGEEEVIEKGQEGVLIIRQTKRPKR